MIERAQYDSGEKFEDVDFLLAHPINWLSHYNEAL
jgi:hypothetical protein